MLRFLLLAPDAILNVYKFSLVFDVHVKISFDLNFLYQNDQFDRNIAMLNSLIVVTDFQYLSKFEILK